MWLVVALLLRPSLIQYYGLAGASAEEVQVVVRRLVEARPRPQLILYTMSPRQLSTKNDGPSPNVLMLWRVSDWWRSRSIHGAKVDGLLPDAARNEFAERSHLFRLRTEIHTALFSPGQARRHGESDLDFRAQGSTRALADAGGTPAMEARPGEPRWTSLQFSSAQRRTLRLATPATLTGVNGRPTTALADETRLETPGTPSCSPASSAESPRNPASR